MEFHEFKVVGSTFIVPSCYTDIVPVGMGAFGLVCSGKKGEDSVAIKKISQPFNNHILAKRTFRELSLLIHLRRMYAIMLMI